MIVWNLLNIVSRNISYNFVAHFIIPSIFMIDTCSQSNLSISMNWWHQRLLTSKYFVINLLFIIKFKLIPFQFILQNLNLSHLFQKFLLNMIHIGKVLFSTRSLLIYLFDLFNLWIMKLFLLLVLCLQNC